VEIYPYKVILIGEFKKFPCRDYPLISVPTPSAEHIKEIKSRGERMGVIIEVGE
jgi:hypothetical protein